MFNVKRTKSKNADSSLHYGFYGSYFGENIQTPHNKKNQTRNSLNMICGVNTPSTYLGSRRVFHKMLKRGGRTKYQTMNLIFSFTRHELNYNNPHDILRSEHFVRDTIQDLYGKNIHAVLFPQNDNQHHEPHIHAIICNHNEAGKSVIGLKHRHKGRRVNNSSLKNIRRVANQFAPKYRLGRAVRKGQMSKDYIDNYKEDLTRNGHVTANTKIFRAYVDAYKSARSKKEFRNITKKQGVTSHFSRKYKGLYFTWQDKSGKRQFKKASDLPKVWMPNSYFKISYSNALAQIKQNARRYYIKRQESQKQAQSPVSYTRQTKNGSEANFEPNKSKARVPKITKSDLRPEVKQTTYTFKNHGFNGGDPRNMPNNMHVSREPLQHPIYHFHPKNPRINTALNKLTQALSLPGGDHQKNVAKQAAIAKARSQFDDDSAKIVTENQQEKAFVRQQNKENAEQVKEQNAEVASAQRYQMEEYYRNQGPSW